MKLKRFFLLIVLLFACQLYGCFFFASKSSNEPETSQEELAFNQGDVLLQSLGGYLCLVIADVTESKLTHCGMIVENDGALVVIEALGWVRYTPIDQWLARGGGKYVHMRPRGMVEEKISASVRAAKTYLGLPYDMQFEMDDKKQYCSELVYKAFLTGAGVEVGKKLKLGEMKWEKHEAFIRGLAGGELPLDREIIPPVSLVENEHLQLLFSNLTE